MSEIIALIVDVVMSGLILGIGSGFVYHGLVEIENRVKNR